MQRMKENYHTIHILKHARPKLRKAIISNCDLELVNCINECVLNVLYGNGALTGCVKRKFSTHRLDLRKFVSRHLLLHGKERVTVQRGGSSSPPVSNIAHTCLSHSCQVTLVTLHKMYLVPAEEYHASPSPAKRGRPSSRSRPKKNHPNNEWIKLRTKHREAELQRNAQTKEIANCMKQIMSAVTISQTLTPDTVLPRLKAKSRRGTQTAVTSASVSNPQIRPSKEIIY